MNPKSAPRLETLLQHWPPARRALLRLVAEAAQREGMAPYLVGGVVRDLLLGLPSLDYDVVLEGPAPRLARHLARAYGGRVQVHSRFGTAKWHLPPREAPHWRQALARYEPGLSPEAMQALPAFLDLVTARRETYSHPGALPQVTPADIHADLARRDFTINAMAYPLSGPQAGYLLDPFHGLEDLRAGRLRALHPRSFEEDPTRIARAARYAARFGFHLEEGTARQIPPGLAVVPRVSGDRWRRELDHILEEEAAARALGLLAEWNLLPAVHPALPAEEAALERVARWQPPPPAWGLPDPWEGAPLKRLVRYGLWLLECPPPGLDAVDARLHFPRRLRRTVESAAHLWATRDTWAGLSPGLLTLHLERHPLPAVYTVYLAETDPERRRALEAFATRWRHVRAPLTGHDLRALGLKPGPAYAQWLRELRMAAIEGRISNAEEARAWVQARRAKTPDAPARR